jgi:Immunoglobulin domain
VRSIHLLAFVLSVCFLSASFAPPAHAQSTITIGDKNIESAGDSGNGNLVPAQAVALSQAATLQSLSFYVTGASGNLILGIYDATGPGGHPGKLLAATGSFATVNGWNTANVVTPVSLAAGNYWLAYLPSSSSLSFPKQNDSGSCVYQAQTFSNGMPATFATSVSDCSPTTWSFYATLVTSGSGSAVAPSITTQPQSQTVTAGATATFTVVASGTAPLSYQWSRNGAAIAGATSASYTTPATVSSDSGSTFTVTVSNTAGSQRSNAATLTVNSSSTIIIGDKNLESGLDNGNGNLVPAQEVALAQSATIVSLSFYVTQASGSLILGLYDATGPGGHPGKLLAVTNSFATVKGWNTASVVTSVSLAPGNYWLAYLPSSSSLSFLKQNNSGNCVYQARTFSNGMPATFPTSVSDCSPTTWSFYASLVPSGGGTVVNGVCGSSNGGTFSSAPTTNLCSAGTASSVTGSGPWNWTCAGSGGGTTASCSAQPQSGSAVAPTITTQPQSQTVTAGSTATFSVVASGTTPLSYQWSKNGAAIAGATSASYTTPATVSTDSGSTFTVKVSNSAGSQTSNAATLTVNTGGSAISVSITPKRAAVTFSQRTQFSATVTGDSRNLGTTWAVDGTTGGNSTAGTISNSGLYTPGTQPGSHTVTATSVADTSKSASVAIVITDLTGVFTYHNDVQRTGVNPKEYALTASTVNASSFGLLFSCSVDAPGYVYAQPLYVANLMMNDGQLHNVLFVATESDWVYAYDADASSCQQLWRKRVLVAGEATVNPADVSDTTDLTPEIGVTSTPVIDPATGTLYVVSKSEDSSGGFHHRLYALDLATGNTKFGSPVQITATHFNVLTHMQRPALLLNNGTVYIAFGSHGDAGTYQGWVMGYDATTLAQKFVWSATDPTNGNNQGAIWMYGNGPAADSSGNVYLETANGVFDANGGGHNYSDSVVKLSSSGAVLDYFTPFNQSMLAADDVDLGSSGPIVLPDSLGRSGHPHLLLATGKTGMLYVLDRDNLGRYNSASDNALQEVGVAPNNSSVGGGVFGQPVLFNGAVYVAANRKPIQRFTIDTTSLSSTFQSQSAHSFTFRGVTPAASANGTSNGIVWALDTSGDPTSGNPAPAVLFAYDAANLGTLLYSSPTSGIGASGTAIKSTVPTVANGKVYIGGAGTFSVFGLLPN